MRSFPIGERHVAKLAEKIRGFGFKKHLKLLCFDRLLGRLVVVLGGLNVVSAVLGFELSEAFLVFVAGLIAGETRGVGLISI